MERRREETHPPKKSRPLTGQRLLCGIQLAANLPGNDRIWPLGQAAKPAFHTKRRDTFDAEGAAQRHLVRLYNTVQAWYQMFGRPVGCLCLARCEMS